MFEIIAIIILSEKVSTLARTKGYTKTGRFVLLFLITWFLSEFIGSIVATLFTTNMIVIYTFGLGCAIANSFIAFIVVQSLKDRELKKQYNPNIQIDVPYTIALWKENLVGLIFIGIASVFMITYVSPYMLIIPLFIILFTRYGIRNVTFTTDGIRLNYLYGRVRNISKDQVMKIYLNNKLMIDINWKKSSRHSTKVIRFSSNDFLSAGIPADNISHFFSEVYG